jgi:hypothetical protein
MRPDALIKPRLDGGLLHSVRLGKPREKPREVEFIASVVQALVVGASAASEDHSGPGGAHRGFE